MTVNELIQQCKEELIDREYMLPLQDAYMSVWEEFKEWMNEQRLTDFTEELGFLYCTETFGGCVLSKIDQKKHSRALRGIRMLITYYSFGDFEFRTPKDEKVLIGETGIIMQDYFNDMKSKRLSEKTINNRKYYLLSFNLYLETRGYSLEDIEFSLITDFYTFEEYSLASISNCNNTLRQFLRYVFDVCITDRDYSIFITPDNYKRHSKIPTTYEEEEIQRMICAV